MTWISQKSLPENNLSSENQLFIIGFDEAGYGPSLGPLCAAAVVLPAEDNSAQNPIPDSKQVYKGKISNLIKGLNHYLPGSHWSRDMLHSSDSPSCFYHQEFLTLCDQLLPKHVDVAPPTLAIKTLHPLEFNQKVGEGLNKADLLLDLYGDLLRQCLENIPESSRLQFHFDRLGGRKFYSAALEKWGFTKIKVCRQENQSSQYTGYYQNKAANIGFWVGGDKSFHSIALASYGAKCCRELHMGAFNRWWQERIPDLHPTAGYPADAPRFLSEIETYRISHNVDIQLIRRSR